MEAPTSPPPANSPASLECTTDTSGLTSIPTNSMDSSLLGLGSSHSQMAIPPILHHLPPLLLPVFTLTLTFLHPPSLDPTPRALRQNPVALPHARLERARQRSDLSLSAISTSEAATIEWLLPLPLLYCLSRSLVRICSHFDLIYSLIRHLF